MPVKDLYEERVQAHIDTLYEAIDHHKAHLESTGSTSMESHLTALRDLKEKRQAVDSLLAELKSAGEHGWQNVRDVLDPAVEDIKHAFEQARDRLHGPS